MFPLEPSYPTTSGPEYSTIAEAQKRLKTAFIKMIVVLKQEKNKSLKETQETTKKIIEWIS